jgi:hypothetical protein
MKIWIIHLMDFSVFECLPRAFSSTFACASGPRRWRVIRPDKWNVTLVHHGSRQIILGSVPTYTRVHCMWYHFNGQLELGRRVVTRRVRSGHRWHIRRKWRIRIRVGHWLHCSHWDVFTKSSMRLRCSCRFFRCHVCIYLYLRKYIFTDRRIRFHPCWACEWITKSWPLTVVLVDAVSFSSWSLVAVDE